MANSKPARKQLTVAELRPIVEDYRRAFPEWILLEPDMLARDSGPLLQYIGFERLTYVDYRIMCGVRYLCVPDRDGGMGPHFLSIQYRSVHPRAHADVFDKIIEAIRFEIQPSVDAPLDAVQVIGIHESQELFTSPDARNLAALNAYVGNEKRALFWCDRFGKLLDESVRSGIELQEWDYKRQAFVHNLATWITCGDAKSHLGRIVLDERRNWGLH